MIYRVYAQGPGIGDALWLSALALNFSIQKPDDNLIIVSNHPELFDNNNHIYKAEKFGPKKNDHNIKDIRLSFNPPIHAIDGYCLQLGLKPPFLRRNRMYFTLEEADFGVKIISDPSKIITIQSQAGPWTRNKDWIFEHHNKVIDYFRSYGYSFIQIGGSDDKPLDNCIHVNKKGFTVRQSAALICRSVLFVGPISAGMHISSAVSTPAVIIFGGREDPNAIALENHVCLYSKISCAPCWKIGSCPNNMKCMKNITPDIVIEKMNEVLNQNV